MLRSGWPPEARPPPGAAASPRAAESLRRHPPNVWFVAPGYTLCGAANVRERAGQHTHTHKVGRPTCGLTFSRRSGASTSTLAAALAPLMCREWPCRGRGRPGRSGGVGGRGGGWGGWGGVGGGGAGKQGCSLRRGTARPLPWRSGGDRRGAGGAAASTWGAHCGPALVFFCLHAYICIHMHVPTLAGVTATPWKNSSACRLASPREDQN